MGEMTYKTSGGGPGHAGFGGYAGHAGVAGRPGIPGEGGYRPGCERGRNGTTGSPASGGAPGITANRGNPGIRGRDSMPWRTMNLSLMPGPGRGENAVFEPGATYKDKDCTEWFWVAYQWDRSQPHETGRTLIGCY
jgi:hypothetical protein